jgi:hypothetical protein
MAHRFVVKKDNEILEFQRYEDIPDEFDHLLGFLPEIPPPPHTDEQHEEIESWISKFNRLMEIEHASTSKSR